jgi:hypothetical protein
VRHFAALGPVPALHAVPRQPAALILSAMAGGLALGFGGRRAGLARRLTRAVFFSSAFGYLGVSLLDFWEHFRLEKKVTGHFLRAQVVPLGETLNHAATGATILALLALGRPLPRRPALRDLYCLLAPGIFLLLGWRDELRFHRRRCQHREDIMHTVAHLAGGVMLASFVAMRLTPPSAPR